MQAFCQSPTWPRCIDAIRGYESGLVTQYPVYLKDEDFKEAFVEQINPAPLE